MPNDIFREIVSIAREYLDEYTALSLVANHCSKVGATPDTVGPDDLCLITLHLISDEALLEKLEPIEFSAMMKKCIALSNRYETRDKHAIRRLVKEKRAEKKEISSQMH